MLSRACGVVAIGLLAFAPFVTEEASATPVSKAAPSQQQQSCDDYTPRDLALNVTSAAPGQTVTITGLAFPGDTVTIRISQLGGPPIVLATVVAGPDGQFSTPIVIPADYPEGTYNITASSPNCPGVSTITIVVRFPGGRCLDRVTITAQRGDSVTWELLGQLDTTKPLTVTLVPVAGGPSVVVFTGAYPVTGSITFTVPASFSNGRYRIVESGTGLNGKPLSARCGRLRVRGGGGGGTTTTTSTTTIPGGGSTTTIPGGTCDSFEFDPTVKLIDFDGFNPKVEFSPIVPAALPAGAWNVTEASSWDSYDNRVNVFQGSEVWEIQFLDAGGNVLAHSGPTGDVPDFVNPGQWSGALGAVTLPAGVVGVRAHHLPDLYPDGPDGKANSVFPVGFSICGGGGSGTTTTTEPESTTTTEPESTTTTQPDSTTTTAPASTTTTTQPESTTTTSAPESTTTQPGSTTTTSAPESTSTTSTSTTSTSTTTSTTSSTIPGGGGGGSTTTTSTTSTTAPSTTSTSTTVVTPTTVPVQVENNTVNRIGSTNPTQVAGNSTTRSTGGSGGTGLATTGSTVRPLIALGAVLIAVGTLFALGARRRRR